MRNATSNTPTTKKGQEEDAQADRSSAKKLVQARLPFKIIAPGSSPSGSSTLAVSEEVGSVAAVVVSKDGRKRKLSYDEDEVEVIEQHDEAASERKENLVVKTLATKKKKIVADTEGTESDVVLDDEDVNTVVAESVDKKNKKTTNAAQTLSPQTPKPTGGNKRKGAGTPRSASATQSKSSSGGSSATKLQIKLPLSGSKKNKRRKSMRKSTTDAASADNELTDLHAESSDDIDKLAVELNPQKRPKVEAANPAMTSNENLVEIIDLESDFEEAGAKQIAEKVTKNNISRTKSKEENIDKVKITKKVNLRQKVAVEAESKSSSADEQKDHVDAVVTDIEADDEADITINTSGSSEGVVVTEPSVVNSDTTQSLSSKTSAINSTQRKTLTPKQIKLHEQRHKAREEKERKLQEEKMQKQREKEEKEMAKKVEREEKEEQRRKEREEKEELKRKERDEKERKRLAEVEAKNEEKRKRNEAKEEEIRKKEDERKRKEQEKEEAENKKKKAAEAFTKFFVAKATRAGATAASEPSHTGMKEDTNGSTILETLAFRPFQIKGDMQLAPVCRKVISEDAQKQLNAIVGTATVGDGNDNDAETIVRRKPLPRTKLYLAELRSGKIKPDRWKRPSIDSKVCDDEDDVQIVEDELERAGQAITEDIHLPVEHMRAKFYKFHENRRPPYFGTWRKRTNLITARRPLAQDKKYFDYEVDSDLEWEEEEPGESLDGSDDDKEKESEDDDYEVDNEWFVPHGHLSDEELQNEDEFGGVGDDNTREAQKAKLKILQQEFAQEMKKKTEKIKPRLVGCIWADENGNQPIICPKILWNTLSLRAMLCVEPPLVDEPEQADRTESCSPSANGGMDKTTDKVKPLILNEKALKELIRLIHGNNHSKAFLIKEFIAFCEANDESIKNGDARGPLKSTVRERIEEFSEWKVTEDTNNNSTNKRKKSKKRLCWIVADEILNKMELTELTLHHNSWQYTLQPKFVKSDKEKDQESKPESEEKEELQVDPVGIAAVAPVAETLKSKRNLNISQFAKVLTTEEKNSQQLKEQEQSSSSKKVNSSNAMKATSPQVSKQKQTKSTKTANTAKLVDEKSTVTAPVVKKRVPLLMSVARGQQISTPAKNALISQFLKKSAVIAGTEKTTTEDSASNIRDNDVVVID